MIHENSVNAVEMRSLEKYITCVNSTLRNSAFCYHTRHVFLLFCGVNVVHFCKES